MRALRSNTHLQSIASAYAISRGYVLVREHYETLDTDYSQRTARAYESMPTQSDNAASAYAQLRIEVLAQYEYLREHGYTMHVQTSDPYANSNEMFDAASTRALAVLASDGDAHAYLDAHTNTIFRWVHDLFGHAANGYQFGPRGEFNAAIHHAMMFSPLARRALLTETHGQNSYYQKHHEFAPQKGALLSDDILSTFDTIIERVRNANS